MTATAPAPVPVAGADRSARARVRALLPAKADLVLMGRAPGRDLLAGVTVAVVALPLALGFGISSGLGAMAGIVTAIVAGFVAAVFGGSNLQVSGPTGAMTVVLVPIVAEHGADGVLTVGLLAGLVLLVLAWVGAGRAMRYVPAPVIEGFTLGIACVIALQQMPMALGVEAPEGERVVAVAFDAVRTAVASPSWPALVITVVVAAAILVGARFHSTIPFSLVAVAVATVVVAVADVDVATIESLPSTLPAPSLGFLELSALPSLVVPALAVAALAALESLLSASVADGMSVGQRHDPDRELAGQGLANLAVPLFGGVPATAAIARTAVNVRSGARSRLAAAGHAVVLFVVLLVAARVVGEIPLAALAGVLIATALRMVETASVRAMARASRPDALVLGITATATVVLDLVVAVVLGLAVAGALALRAVAQRARVEEVPIHPDLPGDHTDEEQALLAEHIVAYRIDGPVFFAGAHRFLLELADVADVSVVIIRMSRVTTIDTTGALVLKDVIDKLGHKGIVVMVTGTVRHQLRLLDTLGVLADVRGQGRVFDTTPEAIAAAREHLRAAGVLD